MHDKCFFPSYSKNKALSCIYFVIQKCSMLDMHEWKYFRRSLVWSLAQPVFFSWIDKSHNVTGLIPLSPLSVVSAMVMRESSQCLERIFCGVLVKRTPEKHGQVHSCRNKTEILLKTALNTIQSINHVKVCALLNTHCLLEKRGRHFNF